MSPQEAWNNLVQKVGQWQASALVGLVVGGLIGAAASAAAQSNVDLGIVITAAGAGAASAGTAAGLSGKTPPHQPQ